MVNARLEELSRSADPPFLGAGSARQAFVRAKDVFMQMAATKADGVAARLQALTREVERIDRHGFTAGELERQKVDILRDLDRAVRERDKAPSDRATPTRWCATTSKNESMPGIVRELELTKEFMPTITLAEMNKVASEWITERNRVLVVQAPESAKVPTEADLRALFSKTEARRRRPLRRQGQRRAAGRRSLPAPGKVVKEKQIAELGVTEWRLSNGIRVVAQADGLQERRGAAARLQPGRPFAHRRTRTSNRPAYAAGVIGASGLGTFGPTELRKALAGKVVGVHPYIDELEEGVRGEASPDDLETLFSLVYLTVTAPTQGRGVVCRVPGAADASNWPAAWPSPRPSSRTSGRPPTTATTCAAARRIRRWPSASRWTP